MCVYIYVHVWFGGWRSKGQGLGFRDYKRFGIRLGSGDVVTTKNWT